LDKLLLGYELRDDVLAYAIELTLPQNSHREMAGFHRQLIVPTLNRAGELTLVGGDEAERAKLVSYFKELQKVLLSVRRQRM
jgi:hypothetical protein